MRFQNPLNSRYAIGSATRPGRILEASPTRIAASWGRPRRFAPVERAREQQIVRYAIRAVQPTPEELQSQCRRRGSEPRLRITDRPVSGGEPGEEREDHVAHQARPGNGRQVVLQRQPIGFRVVGTAGRHRMHDPVQIVRIHLSVAGHHADDVSIGAPMPADSQIRWRRRRLRSRPLDQRDAGVDRRQFGDDLTGSIGTRTAVIDDDDVIDEAWHRLDHTGDLLVLPVRRYDHCDPTVQIHTDSSGAVREVSKRTVTTVGQSVLRSVRVECCQQSDRVGSTRETKP